jgi:hypothetical protein
VAKDKDAGGLMDWGCTIKAVTVRDDVNNKKQQRTGRREKAAPVRVGD